MVWISSMKTITRPSAAATSRFSAVMRSLNEPRICVPDTMEPTSSPITTVSAIDGGTSPVAMRSARPSAMAVLPTPGSPIKQGLLARRLCRTSMTSSSSRSRPMSGSILPSAAITVRLRPSAQSVG